MLNNKINVGLYWRVYKSAIEEQVQDIYVRHMIEGKSLCVNCVAGALYRPYRHYKSMIWFKKYCNKDCKKENINEG